MENSKLGAFATSTQLSDEQIFQQGLTKREYFAGLAMQGMLSACTGFDIKASEYLAICAIKQADELLKRLENKQD